MEQQPKFKGLSIEVEAVKPMTRRKYTKNMQSELIPRRTDLKIIRLDEQIMPSPTATNIINLEFGQDPPNIFKRTKERKPNKKISFIAQQKRQSIQKDFGKNRYHQLFKQSVDYFLKNTIQIGPSAKSIIKQSDLNDMYAQRKLINIQKLAFPLRETKRDLTARYKYKTLMNRTSRGDMSEDKTPTSNNYRNLSAVGAGLEGQRIQATLLEKGAIQPIFDISLIAKQDLKSDYKKEISTLLPIRKPNNKKDFFVFGLSDRTNTSQNKIQIYRDLLWKVNFSNSLFVCTPQLLPVPYKFYVGEGNNSNLIRGIFRRRFWWAQAVSKNEEGINFTWTQLKINSFFSTQETALIPEYFVVERIQSQISRGTTSSHKRIKESEVDHNAKLFGRIDYKIWKNHCNKNEKSQKKISETTYQRRIKMYQKKKITKIQDSRNIKMHNHLQSNFYIGNKKALFYNLKRYLELKGQDPFAMLPLTFHIHKGTEDTEYLRFTKYYQMIEQEKKVKKHIKNIWIVKPGENTNRGNGITVCYSLDDIKVRLKGRQRNGDGKLRTFILQKYIENPLLYNKRKFDIRHYILITCINGSFKGYWYEQGYVRTSSAEFSIKSSKDPLVHLTNDAIQKYTPDYGKYQKANKLSYAELDKYLQTTYPRKAHFFERILPKMKLFATEAVRATYSILDPNRKKHNFELLGLDFMIDEDFQPWLIEVNTNPCLQLCCPHLQRIIPSVVQNVFKICIDPLFPPPQIWPNNRKPFIGDDPLIENRFQIIFDESSDGKQIERLYHGKDKIDGLMGKIEQDNQTYENDGDAEWDKQ